MSSEILERIKQQAAALTALEKAQLASFLTEQLAHNQQAQIADGGQGEADAETSRLKRMEWLKSNRDEHGGQYVALDGDKLVAVGQNYREAREKARAVGKPDAFVTYLTKPDEVAEWGGWR